MIAMIGSRGRRKDGGNCELRSIQYFKWKGFEQGKRAVITDESGDSLSRDVSKTIVTGKQMSVSEQANDTGQRER